MKDQLINLRERFESLPRELEVSLLSIAADIHDARTQGQSGIQSADLLTYAGIPFDHLRKLEEAGFLTINGDDITVANEVLVLAFEELELEGLETEE